MYIIKLCLPINQRRWAIQFCGSKGCGGIMHWRGMLWGTTILNRQRGVRWGLYKRCGNITRRRTSHSLAQGLTITP